MKSEVKFLFSQLGLYQPIEIYLEEPAQGVIYFFGQFVRFKAHIEIGKLMRPFNLSLPKRAVLRAFASLPVRDKNCKLLRVVMQKEKDGRLNIMEWEAMK